MQKPFFIGIDIGTQGARVVLIDAGGTVITRAEQPFPLNEQSRQEQSPAVWWDACLASLKELNSEMSGRVSPEEIEGIAVTSTSGTVIPLDVNHHPLHNALMYSDGRSINEAEICKAAAEKHIPDGYTGFNPSSGLSKMVWYQSRFPEEAQKLRHWVHAADYITGKLSDIWGVSDYTNVLKSGFDPESKSWPDYICNVLALKKEWLPEVVPSGEVLGQLSSRVAEETGLSAKTKVVAGMTDGCASQIASGAVNVGEWNTTIGTTLVVKGVTRNRIMDPAGRLYSHLHPMGYWMPGGASNTGADWITKDFSSNLDVLNRKALTLFPTRHISYPLKQNGERFPFMAPQARGFEPEGIPEAELFTANLEGVAYLERYAFDLIHHLSGEDVHIVYTAGGGSKSDAWLKIRSNVLNVPVCKMKHDSGDVGAAILAASNTCFDSVVEAGKALTKIEKEVHPEEKIRDVYKQNYQKFLETLTDKGYIEGGFNA